MATKKNKQLLPLLSITAIFLSIGLIMSNNNLLFSTQENPSVLSKSTENVEEMSPKLPTESKVNRVKPRVKGDTKKEVKPSPSFSPRPVPSKPSESAFKRFWSRFMNK